jgi:SulP family sulfate permease
MTYTIMAKTGTSQPNVVLATVITSYAVSSIITGVVFFILGAFKLGSLVSFFPRHILIGCVGGVGFFLFVTGIEVSARLDGNLEYNLETAKKLFRGDTVVLWIIPLALAILLMVAQRFSKSPYVVPGFFIAITAVFYIVVSAVSQLNVPLLRENGWIFPAVEAGVPFYHFYSYYGMHQLWVKIEDLLTCLRFQCGRLESLGVDSSGHVCPNILWHLTCANQHSRSWNRRGRR